MNSFYRIFFFSSGSVCLLIVPLFWLGLYTNYAALENFTLRISEMRFVGYSAAEVIGISGNASTEKKHYGMVYILSSVVLFYAILLIGTSYLDGIQKKFKVLAGAIAIPLFAFLTSFWIRFNTDDHILSKSEKMELFQFSAFSLFLIFFLFWFTFSKSRVKIRSIHPYSDNKTNVPISTIRKNNSTVSGSTINDKKIDPEKPHDEESVESSPSRIVGENAVQNPQDEETSKQETSDSMGIASPANDVVSEEEQRTNLATDESDFLPSSETIDQSVPAEMEEPSKNSSVGAPPKMKGDEISSEHESNEDDRESNPDVFVRSTENQADPKDS